MCFTLTAIVGLDPRCQFVGTPQTVRFRDGPLPMDPLRFNRVKPRACAGQGADDDAYTDGAPFALLLVLAAPHAQTAIVPALTGRPGTNRSPMGSSCCGCGRPSNPEHARAWGSGAAVGGVRAWNGCVASASVQPW